MLSDYLIVVVGAPVVGFIPALKHGAFSSKFSKNANENVRRYEALITHKPTIPLDENISRRAGVLEGQHLTSDAKPTLGPGDAIIAATGLVYNEPIVTNNGDFESVDGLQVELY